MFCRKTSPCSKGIETIQYAVNDESYSRKTSPCSKGIETIRVLFLLVTLLRVERHRPARKGLRRLKLILVTTPLFRSKDIALLERD